MPRSGEAFQINRLAYARGIPLVRQAECYVECFNRRGDMFTFIAFGVTARQARDFLRAGDWFAIDFKAATIAEYDGEITRMSFIQKGTYRE